MERIGDQIMFLFPVKKMQLMLEAAEPGFKFVKRVRKKRYTAEYTKDGVKKYTIHTLKKAVNDKWYWFYDIYVLDPDTMDYTKNHSGKYPFEFIKS